MAKTIYLIPGVGANEKIFRHLEFPADHEIVHLKWVKPRKGEHISSYAKRLLPQFKANSEAIIIGMSFGGIVAVELSKLVSAHKTIIISSIKKSAERPLKFGFFSTIRLHRLVPGALVARFDFWMEWVLGKLSKKDRQLIQEMIDKIDIPFNEWAADQAIHWENEEHHEDLVHIHGTHDRIFPSFYINDAHMIKGGTHFMVVNRAKEVSRIIHRELGAATKRGRVVKMRRSALAKAS